MIRFLKSLFFKADYESRLLKLVRAIISCWIFYPIGLMLRLAGWPASDKQMVILAYYCLVLSLLVAGLAVWHWWLAPKDK